MESLQEPHTCKGHKAYSSDPGLLKKKKKIDQLWQDLRNTAQGDTHVHGMMPPRDKGEDRSIYGPTYTKKKKKKNQTLQI